MPFPDLSFDIVFCSNALDHTEDPNKTVTEIHRVLKPQGYFVLTIEIFQEQKTRDPAHPHSFRKRDVYSILDGKFTTMFEKESPWIGVKTYFNGSRKSRNKELIMVLQKA